MSTFNSVDPNPCFPQVEVRMLDIWNKTDAFRRQVEERANTPDNHYIFYDGPPFATGLPHYGHLVASTLKDVVPRYWAMRGKRVERRFGWDTHGLPVEMEVEKRLDLSGPSSVRAFGVAEFNEACRANVLRYTAEWERTITRLGRWVDFKNDYKTMDLSYMESVWWAFKTLWDKDLIYKGVRVMPYSWRLSTPLSNFEAKLDYRDVDDPAITVRVPIVNDPDGAFLLVWTTTPWTLPSNLAIAVGEDIEYVRAKRPDDDAVYVIAKARVTFALGGEHKIIAELTGKDLVGKSYTPLFPYFADRKDAGAFRVIAAPHVTTESGTGLVHMAPAYGEEDFTACANVGIEPVDPVDEEGRFTSLVGDYVGVNVKDADVDIIKRLKSEGKLIRNDRIRHSYPFCWRSGTPLIYKTVPVWFVRVEKLRDQMVENNASIHWVPDAVGSKRFGNWLKDARDWAISRNRFWGTPLPVWQCDKPECSAFECLGDVDSLRARTNTIIDDIHPHKIDHLTFSCTMCSGTMRRIPEVFDCWFESGAMPYAQLHYPFENKEKFEANFPAHFVAEGLDQTRGWFYTLLALSTALFDKAPFSNVIVNGLVLAEDGAKMSKSKQNYPDPALVLSEHGADALRAYLINSPVMRAEPLRFSEAGVRDVVRNVLLPLQNAWSFFVQYANIDGWSPKVDIEKAPDLKDRPELDRWIVSLQQALVEDVNEQMEGYYLFKIIPPLMDFIDNLTNWYIRRSRRRFWRAADLESHADKMSAYATLYEVLVTFSKLMAPVLPFLTEAMYQNLVKETGIDGAKDSVHLCDYPLADVSRIDRELLRTMTAARTVVSLGRTLRESHKIKTRQPLLRAIVISCDDDTLISVSKHRELILEELNVKDLVLLKDDTDLAILSFRANFKTLGKRMGKRMKEAAIAVEALTRDDWNRLEAGERLPMCDDEISAEDVIVSRTPKGDVVLKSASLVTVALDTALDDELRAEGMVREVISRIQRTRKESGLAVTDRITVTLQCDPELYKSLVDRALWIKEEVLATAFDVKVGATGPDALDFNGHKVSIAVTCAQEVHSTVKDGG